MRNLILAAIISLSCGVHSVALSPVSVVQSASHEASVKNARVGFRKDLTRVYCSFVARPHTAHRIDKVTLGGIEAIDIDGVDMGRYFQTEESGRIDLEIDFPPMKPCSPVTLDLTTAAGKISVVIERKGSK